MPMSVNAGARMDRLPVFSFHMRLLLLVSMGAFFDSFDNTLSGSVLASMLETGWSTLELNSVFMSVTFAGLALGAVSAGWLSDHFGRRFTYQVNLLIFGGMSLASAFAPSMHWLIAIRAIMAVGMGAEYVMGYGIITEFMPPERRGRYIGWFAVFGGVGVFVTALVSMVVIPHFGWRIMFLVGGIGTLSVWWARRYLPESPRWLESVGRSEEAERLLGHLEALASAEKGLLKPLPDTARRSVSRDKVPLSVLFSVGVLNRTSLAIVVAVIALFGAYSLTGWMPTFFVKQGMNIAKSLAFNMTMMGGFGAGTLLCVVLADRIGRRWGLAVFGCFVAVTGSIYPFLYESWQVLTCGFLLVAGVAVFLTLGLGFVSELFPTEYRFRGSGLAQTTGRVVLIASPYIVLKMFGWFGIGGVVGLIAVLYLIVAALLIAFGVETNQRSLEDVEPEVVSEDELIFRKKGDSSTRYERTLE